MGGSIACEFAISDQLAAVLQPVLVVHVEQSHRSPPDRRPPDNLAIDE
ncbi:MAG: hypothetical protein AB7G28_14360 [Pirellulales bacterium]